MGPARGRRGHSYRAEACGLLSFLRFLVLRIADFTQMHEQWRGILATESQSVLDKLFGRDQEDNNEDAPVDLDNQCVVLDPLCPEWDVLIRFKRHSEFYQASVSNMWKVYQDQKKPYHALKLLEQLNVDEDRIAEEYLELLQPQRPNVLISPHARAQAS